MQKKKLKIKPKARKLLIIVGIFFLLLFSGILFIHFQKNSLRELGYSETAISKIMRSFKISYVKDVGENKTLNAAFESGNYNEDYLDQYKEITYQDQKDIIKNINTLLDKGYSTDEISLILSRGDNEDVNEFCKREEKVEYIEQFLNVEYSKLANYDRYVAYQNETNEDEETTVLYINLEFDKEDYVDPYVIEDFDEYVLVNKRRQLSSTYVPDDLVEIDQDYIKPDEEMEAEESAVEAFYKMAEAAKEDGLGLLINSAYRSYEDQEEVTNIYLEAYGQNYVDNYVARAGFSEHQTGMAFDVASATEDVFVNSEEYNWMMDNAYKYGFILRYPRSKEDITRYKCEAWHYRYVGEEIATYIHENNITYDEYYIMFLDK